MLAAASLAVAIVFVTIRFIVAGGGPSRDWLLILSVALAPYAAPLLTHGWRHQLTCARIAGVVAPLIALPLITLSGFGFWLMPSALFLLFGSLARLEMR